MTDWITGGQPYETPPDVAAQGYANIAPPFGDSFGSLISESSPLRMGWDWAQRHAARVDQEQPDISGVDDPADKKMLSPTDANKQYAPQGETITDKPVSERLAQVLGQQKTAQVDRDGTLQRWGANTSWPTRFAVGTAAFMMDPLNAATAFLPGPGEASVLARLGYAGAEAAHAAPLAARVGARLVSGAIGGAEAQAPLSALKVGLNADEQGDYDLRQGFLDMAYSGAANAVFHAGFGGLSDLLKGRRGATVTPNAQFETVGVTGAERSVQNASGDLREMSQEPTGQGPALVSEVPGSADAGMPEARASAKVLNAAPQTKYEAMSAAVSQISDGRELDVSPVYGAADAENFHAAPPGTNNPPPHGSWEQLIGDIESKVVRPTVADVAAHQGISEAEAAKVLNDLSLRPDSPIELARNASAEGDMRWRFKTEDRYALSMRQLATYAHNTYGIGESDFPSRAAFVDHLYGLEAEANSAQSEPRYNPHDLAEEQQRLYSNGYAPGIPQAEFDATNEQIYGKPEEGKPEQQPKSAETASGKPASPAEADLADAEARWQVRSPDMEQHLLPEERADLQRTEAALAQAQQKSEAFDQAASCLKGAGV